MTAIRKEAVASCCTSLTSSLMVAVLFFVNIPVVWENTDTKLGIHIITIVQIVPFFRNSITTWEPGQRSRYSDWLRAGRPRGRTSSPSKGKIFRLSTSSKPVLGPTPPPIQWVPGALSPEVRRPGREADHSPPTSVEVKNTWIYTSTPPYAFMA
jgi:hypothetical protein